MENLQKKTTARICMKLTNLFWYLFLIIGTAAPIALLLAYVGKLPEVMNIDIVIPISTDVLSLTTGETHSALSIDEAKAKMNLAYVAQEFPNLFFDISLYTVAGLILLLGILYNLKNLLKATLNDAVFTRQNITRIKIIAVLIFIIDPLKWIFINFITQPLFAEVSTGITISFPSPGYWFIGLLVYMLAAVFEQGHEMYQELKLTV